MVKPSLRRAGGWPAGCAPCRHPAPRRTPRRLFGTRVPDPSWLLAKATPKLESRPMTSPVERISGPSSTSTPGKRAKGNTASLTAMCSRTFGRRSKLASDSPDMTRAAILAIGSPITLATNGYRARGARIHLQHVDHAVLDRVLDVHQATDLSGPGPSPLVWRSSSAMMSRTTGSGRAGSRRNRPSGCPPPRCAP